MNRRRSRDRRSRSRSPTRRSRSSSRDKRRDRSGSRRRRDRSGSRDRRRDRSGSRRRDRSSRRGRDRSRSPRRGGRGSSPRRRRRSRSDSRRRSGRRRSNRHSSRSRSPSRRRRRRRGSPGRSRSPRRRRGRSISDESSTSEDDRRGGSRRRRGGRRNRRRRRRRGRGFRVGDKVELRVKSKYGRQGGWEKGEIDEVDHDGMYGEVTYKVYVENRGDWEHWVSAGELRHQRDLTRAEAIAEMENRELRKQLRSQQRLGVGGDRDPYDERGVARPGRGPRDHRDRYAGSTRHSPVRHHHHHGRRGHHHNQAYSEPDPGRERPHETPGDGYRAGSVPLNYTWPQFIADLTHAVYNRDKETVVEDHEDDQDPAADQTVDAPAQVRSLYGRDDKKEEDYDTRDQNYNDDDVPYDPRELVQDSKNGGNRATDEISVQGREDRAHRRGAESYTASPLIYVNIATDHQEPYSNRNHDRDYYDTRTPGR